MQNYEFRLPEGYEPVEADVFGNPDVPESARFFRSVKEGENVILTAFPVSEEQSMPFAGEDLSAYLKEEISSSEILLFSKKGITCGGRPYVCDVLKRRNAATEAYMFNFNLREGDEIFYLGGKFPAESSLDGIKEFYEYVIKKN